MDLTVRWGVGAGLVTLKQHARERAGAYPSVNIGIMLMESGLLSDLGSMRFPNFQEGVHYGYARTPC